jgi:hypothetical protein
MRKIYNVPLDSPYSDFLEARKSEGRVDYVDSIRLALDAQIAKEKTVGTQAGVSDAQH